MYLDEVYINENNITSITYNIESSYSSIDVIFYENKIWYYKPKQGAIEDSNRDECEKIITSIEIDLYIKKLETLLNNTRGSRSPKDIADQDDIRNTLKLYQKKYKRQQIMINHPDNKILNSSKGCIKALVNLSDGQSFTHRFLEWEDIDEIENKKIVKKSKIPKKYKDEEVDIKFVEDYLYSTNSNRTNKNINKRKIYI